MVAVRPFQQGHHEIESTTGKIFNPISSAINAAFDAGQDSTYPERARVFLLSRSCPQNPFKSLASLLLVSAQVKT